MTRKQLILSLYGMKAIKFGSFTLKSRRVSPFYIDLRLLAGQPEVMRAVARMFVRELQALKFQRLAAIPYTGLVIGSAVSITGNYPLIFTRREAKGYGTGRLIEGGFKKGDRAVVIDDVISDGASKVETIDVLEKAGLRLRDFIVLVDRQEGGSEALAARGYALHRIFTIEQVLSTLAKAGMFSQRWHRTFTRRLADYYSRYGGQ